MSSPVGLLGLAPAFAPHRLDQADVAETATRLLKDRFAGYQRMAAVFITSGIRERQAVVPLDWFMTPKTWPERTEAYLAGATDLFIHAAEAALADAGVTADRVDTVVTVSSTGIATPSLEARAMSRLGFRADVQRVPVFGLGCAGGVTGLSLAARLARARPGSVVLLVVVETCTLSFRMDELSKADIVATALFGDGAAAAVLRAGEAGFARVVGEGEHTWPETLDIMGWRVDPTGFGVIFDRAIPPFARRELKGAVEAILDAQGLTPGDIDRVLCHPGGVKVIEAIEAALELDEGALDHERVVLAQHGNMSAPTALFVLERARRAGLAPRSLLTALGPGFTASGVVVEAGMIASVVILGTVTAQRLGELVLAGQNTRRLMARGGIESGAGHYPFMVAMHAAWLIGLWALAWDRPPVWPLIGVFVGLQAARVWVIATLGGRWTTRVITMQGETRVRRGPFRFVAHPNYVVVALELAILPLAFGLWPWALLFTALNAAMMAVRLRVETRALADADRGVAGA